MQVGHRYRQAGLLQTLVEAGRPVVPQILGLRIELLVRRLFDTPQEGVHRRDHIGMRIEGAAGKGDVRRLLGAKTLHQCMPPAQHAHRQPTTQGLAVGHHVGLDAVILLGAAVSQPETGKHLVENEHDSASGAHFAYLLQPPGVGVAVEMGAALAGQQRRVARGIGVGMQRLQRVDQHTGDIPAGRQHLKRALAEIAQGIDIVHLALVAHSGLYPVPPAVIGPAQPHQVRPAGVVAGQAHRLHHRLGAGHMEGNLVQPGQLFEPLDIVANQRMVGPEHRAQLPGLFLRLGDTLLVKVVAKHVDAIGAGDIVAPVAIDIPDLHTLGLVDNRAALELLAKAGTVGKGHPVGAGEPDVRDAVLQRLAVGQAQGAGLAYLGAQPV